MRNLGFAWRGWKGDTRQKSGQFGQPVAHRITLLALEGCFASNITGTIDLFNTANLVARLKEREPVFDWQVLSLNGRPVRASSGYSLTVDGSLENAPPAKVVMIPAFGSPQPEQLVAAVKRHAALLPWLTKQYESGATLTASCSGSFLLAESGLLEDRPATTSWWLADAFRKRYPKVNLDLASMVTDGGRLICSGSGMSHLDLALHLIERIAGRDIARACAKYTVLDDQRRSQAPYIILNHARNYDPLITKAEKWLKANLGKPIGVKELAAELAVSPRTLARRFTQFTGDSPQVFLQKLRVEAGKALLENTALRMDQILERVGYDDDSAFRRLFRKHTSLSPREYRKRFGVRK
jgi:transcriptional regulator GlxA family with amidase domain